MTSFKISSKGTVSCDLILPSLCSVLLVSQDLRQVTRAPASALHPSYLSLKVTREELPTGFNQLDLPTSLCSHLYTHFTFCVYLFIVCSSSGL